MKIKNKYVKIKQGKKETELHNLILDKYLDLFASSILNIEDKGLDACLINCTVEEEISPSMDNMHWDFYLNEQNLYDNSDYKGTNKIITKYLYELNFEEQTQPFVGQKIFSIGFAKTIEEPSLPDGSDADFELYAILDVSNYNLYVQDIQEFVVERVDTTTTDMVFSSDTEKFPIHLSPRGNTYFDEYEEIDGREVAKLTSIGLGYNSKNIYNGTEKSMSQLDFTIVNNEAHIQGMSIEDVDSEGLFPADTLFPANGWEEIIYQSQKAPEVQIDVEEENINIAFEIDGKSIQSETPSLSNPANINSVADDVNLFDKEDIEEGYFYNSSQISTSSNWCISQIKAEPNTKYYLSGNNYSNTTARIVLLDANKDIVSVLGGYSNVHLITTGNTTSYIGLSIANYSGSSDLDTIKICKGTTATPYSEYGKGTGTIKQRGKNLYNDKYSSYTQPVNYYICPVDLEIGKTYKLWAEKTGETISGCYVAIVPYGTNYSEFSGKQIPAINTTGEGLTSTFTVTNEYTSPKLAIYLNISNEETFNSLFENYNIQLEETNKTDFEPYFNETYTIQTEPLRSLPNGVKDTIEADGIHRRVGRIVLDGSENIQSSGRTNSGLYRYYLAIDNIALGYQKVISNYFKTNSNTVFSDVTEVSINSHPSNHTIQFFTEFETGTDFKTWLSTHNTEVIYELNEEVIEPFTTDQKSILSNITTEIGTNIFTTTDDLLPDIQITQYNPTVYPLDYKLCWIIYKYSIYKFIDTVTGYQDTGRRYTESNFTEKSGDLDLIIRYERG